MCVGLFGDHTGFSEGHSKVIQPRVPSAARSGSKLGFIKMEKTPRLPRGIRPLEPTDFIPSLEKTFATALRLRQKASPRERSFLLWLRLDSIYCCFSFLCYYVRFRYCSESFISIKKTPCALLDFRISSVCGGQLLADCETHAWFFQFRCLLPFSSCQLEQFPSRILDLTSC